MGEIRKDEHEDLWGYGKRLRFVRETIAGRLARIEPAEIRVLDVGCGNGSQLALPLARDNLQVLGIDTDKDSIARARSLACDAPNATFQCGSVEELPNDEIFDVVILSEVLEHTAQPEKLLAASAARLSINGVMIVTVPNGFGGFEIDSWIFRTLRLQRLVDLVARKKDEVMGATENLASGHIQFFTRKRLLRLFNKCGLAIMHEGVGPLLAGPFAGHTLARSDKFIRWNARITDRLPFACASGWYFSLRHQACRRDS